MCPNIIAIHARQFHTDSWPPGKCLAQRRGGECHHETHERHENLTAESQLQTAQKRRSRIRVLKREIWECEKEIADLGPEKDKLGQEAAQDDLYLPESAAKRDEIFDNLKQLEDSYNQRNERLGNTFRRIGKIKHNIFWS